MKTRGFIDPVSLYLIGGAALFVAGFVTGPVIKAKLAPKAPVAELAAKDARLAQAEQRVAEIQAKLDAIKTADDAKKSEMRAQGQQAIAGAQRGIKEVPASPAQQVTSRMIDRAALAYRLADGELPAEKQEEIFRIVDDLLSQSEKRVQDAEKALAVKDAELTAASKEAQRLEKELPAVTEKLAKVSAEKEAAKAQAEEAKCKVVEYAKDAEKANREANSFGAQINQLWFYAKLLLCVYVFAHWILPSLAQQYPNNAALKHLNDTIKSLTSAHV